MALTLEQIEAVAAIVRAGFNISAAAATLDRSQPTLSRQVQDLERALGVRVFARTRNKVAGLTPKGEEILRIGQRMLRDAKNLAGIGRAEAVEDSGELKIATTSGANEAKPSVVKAVICSPFSAAIWVVLIVVSAEGVSAVAEVLSDYPDVPLVTYLPNVSWLDDDAEMAYLDAFRELILPATEVLIGNHKTLTDFLLPEWDAERAPSARELAVAAGEAGARSVLVTGMQLPDQHIDNVLASPEGAITGEKFERFEATFVGAGETLSADRKSVV